MELNEETRHLIRLLAEGKVAEAKAAASAAYDRIRRSQAQLDAALAIVEEVLRSGMQTQLGVEVEPDQAAQLRRGSKMERKYAALSVARDLVGGSEGGFVTTDAVYEEMRRRGLNPPTKTAIGLFLNNATDEWDRVDTGLYRPSHRSAVRVGTELAMTDFDPFDQIDTPSPDDLPF